MGKREGEVEGGGEEEGEVKDRGKGREEEETYDPRSSSNYSPMQSVSVNPNIPFAWLHVTHFCTRSTLR